MQQDLDKKGIYKIVNLKTSKWYVGSVTCSTFKLRFHQHKTRLLTNKHENQHLQNSFNKYGIENFKFEILEVLTSNILEREQWYLDNYFKELYNMNKFAFKPPSYSESTQETRDKQAASTKVFCIKASEYLNSCKEGSIKIEDVPRKYRQWVISRLENIPWNKGLKKQDISYDFLKNVKKTLSPEFMKRAKDVGLLQRLKSKKINVYEYNGRLIGTFQSISDIIEHFNANDSYTLILRSKNISRKLESNNIRKVLTKTQPHHKGLMFRFVDDSEKVLPLCPKDIYSKYKSFNQCFIYTDGRLLEQSDNDNWVNSENIQ